MSKSIMKETKPYLPAVTLQQVFDYIPGQPETYTASRLVNAVAEALYDTKCIESKELAEYLAVDARKLAYAIQLEMDMRLIDVIQQYRIHQVEEYIGVHPDAKLDDVAKVFGYANDSTLWRLFQRKLGLTVRGEKSNAGPELWLMMREEIKKRRSCKISENYGSKI